MNSNTSIQEQYIQKYLQIINPKSYQFLYPSDDSTDCKFIFSVILIPGSYKLECVGASGGKGFFKKGGKGGYSCGVLSIEKETVLYLLIGGKGKSISGVQNVQCPGGYNGGGRGNTGSYGYAVGSGGGATDIRKDSLGLAQRIIVAGGGGGSAGTNSGTDVIGGNGGGTNGASGTNNYANGGTQSAPGYNNSHNGANGSNNCGGNGVPNGSYSAGGGGGGYYGGAGGYNGGAGGGGSGYVSSDLESKFGVSKETKEFDHYGNGYIIITKLDSSLSTET
ncbi:Glycine rich protein [Histomonas meleagridis]|uniref:Glycine rich protein n=1 Tax=Histomonas meleagridis TaxID=135588 RepID=UPI003559AAF1|nr:Glycine rich protein [Histomonas meleagridis]KAH0797884.1 Glycine rich protein [Histomonas meleagridis]